MNSYFIENVSTFPMLFETEPPLTYISFLCQHGANPANMRLYKAAQQSCWHAEDAFVSYASLVTNPVQWLEKTPPNQAPQWDLSDLSKVRATLTDLYYKDVSHYQHGSLLKQDICVAQVSSWVVAESMKGTPGIFEENDEMLTKKLKETLTQSDSLLKLGIGGAVYRGGQGGGRGAQGQGPRNPKGGKGRGAKKAKNPQHLRCFHCKKKVFSRWIFPDLNSISCFRVISNQTVLPGMGKNPRNLRRQGLPLTESDPCFYHPHL